MRKLNFIDLFAGAGGLSEGFITEGFESLAYVEMDKNACETLRTREVYHYLKINKKLKIYNKYLKKKITQEENPKIFSHSKNITKEGRKTAKFIKNNIEKKLGEKVVSSKNVEQIHFKDNKLIEKEVYKK